MTDNIPAYNSQQFSNTFNADLGREIWAFLHEDDNLIRMETATYLARPAVEPLISGLKARFDAPAFEDAARQMTDRMIRQIMEGRGFRACRREFAERTLIFGGWASVFYRPAV